MSLQRLRTFEEIVIKKYAIYNSLFLNLPYGKESNVGSLIPLLENHCRQSLQKNETPLESLEKFFSIYLNEPDEQEKIDFMFRLIQYVERQIVLYDAIEDAAFSELQKDSPSLKIHDYIKGADELEKDRIVNKLSTFGAKLVFTAHPTQFYTPEILDIIAELRRMIQENKVSEIDDKLQQLGLTSLINRIKPTPFEEAKNIIHILRTVYYHSLGKLYHELKVLSNNQIDNPKIIQLGFWPGGDRDGNPFVTSEITEDVADKLRMELMKCYYNDLKAIRSKLTFKDLKEKMKEISDHIYSAMFDPTQGVDSDLLLEKLMAIREVLVKQYHSLYLNELDLFISKVEIFGHHFAQLDIRQDHSVHLNMMQKILAHNEYEGKWEEKELASYLSEKSQDFKIPEFTDEVENETFKNILNLLKIQRKNGEDGCSRYIISNSEDIFSVLFPLALFQSAGWSRNEITFDIVPLFETMVGMEESDKIVRNLFENDWYARHLKNRDNVQHIMLGFSDGTKDGGYFRANWEIYKTKRKLSKICAKYGIKVIFFDGRGGPPARGGGRTNKFYASHGPEIANNEIQLTIQGQTITSIYGTEDQFNHNCEQLLTAGLFHELHSEQNKISPHFESLFDDLALYSYKKYSDLKQHEKFIPYLEKKSTLKHYSQAKIGSRPGKRGTKKELHLSDLRAISFVGAWSQLKQNVPGYFGIGTALSKAAEENGIEVLQKAYQENDFFKALISNSMMSLSKCYFELTSYIKSDPEFGEFWSILFNEFELTKSMIFKMTGNTSLMEEEPIMEKSIAIRDRIVLPLLVAQQYAIQKQNEQGPHESDYEKLVIRSLYGNINASRNSA
ncbi:MAG: phosphoenolpyruvate carboxylase [Bacteroidota bacterium]